MGKEIKINITSTAVEKGLDAAKDFLGKLMMPAIEETGLLLKDQVASWRLKNQVKILNRAKDICEKNNIEAKAISLKLLCPYLEYASLEEDEYMQDKWANLLTNMVDSEQNIENNIFPYILSQISKSEFEVLQVSYEQRLIMTSEYEALLEKKEYIDKLVSNAFPFKSDRIDIMDIKRIPWLLEHLKMYVSKTQEQEFLIKFFEMKLLLASNIRLVNTDLKAYEISNLLRLGILEKYSINKAQIKEPRFFSGDIYGQLESLGNLKDLKVEIESEYELYFTELGQLFISVCSRRSIYS